MLRNKNVEVNETAFVTFYDRRRALKAFPDQVSLILEMSFISVCIREIFGQVCNRSNPAHPCFPSYLHLECENFNLTFLDSTRKVST